MLTTTGVPEALALSAWPLCLLTNRKGLPAIANQVVPEVESQQNDTLTMEYFNQDLQMHKTWRSANCQYNNCAFYTAHIDFITAQIVINCALKYALTLTSPAVAQPGI